MSTDRDTTRIVRSWLRAEENESADRLLGTVLDRLDTTPQRRATWWPVRRFTHMNSTLRLGLAAAAVVVTAVLGLSLFADDANVGGPGFDDPPGPTATPMPSATPVPAIPTSDDLEGGTYRANAFVPVDVLVTVPDGWIGRGDWLLLGPRGVEPPDGMNIRFGSVSSMYANPLDASDGFVEPPIGPTVDDLVEAIVAHPDWSTSRPTDVSIDGHAGKAVRLTLPAEIELSEGRFLFWRDGQGGDRWAFEPGQIIDFYVIDVDGQRLVLELFSYPGTPATDLAERQAVIDSLQLAARP
ncbi:MAG: hypothetical protein M3153_07685 [Chloroflexota bacterium]|nr:hypothetical protein [Chloroflexota bacterium]